MDMEQLLERQRSYFRSGATLPVEFRAAMLKKLYAAIQSREAEITAALRADLGKSDFEGYLCEIGMTLGEIRYMLRHMGRFARPRRVKTPLAQFHARSFTKASPYGNVLIMSPWNYPFLLTMEPLVDAIAAGNTAIVKPSAYAPATGAVVASILRECFGEEFVAVVTGGRRENAALLEQKFDLIFFTGSQAVGKEVLRHGAQHLTPAVLELGGKSPCIVDETANIPLAARRIVFGKFLNCGQTCVAPDYILCHQSVKAELLEQLRAQIRQQFSADPLSNPDYGRIINEKHFDRLLGLIDEKKVAAGGSSCRERLQLAPTLLDDVTWEDAVMQQEIFGPILPILTYDRFEELYGILGSRPKPLALYLFTENRERAEAATTRFQFGGGCVNDVIIHLTTSEMPFGGIGESGMGSYHGKAGFDAFSHTKAIVDKKTWLDLPMRYQPYRKRYEKLVKKILK